MGPLGVDVVEGQGSQEMTGIGRAPGRSRAPSGIWREPVWPSTVTERSSSVNLPGGQIVQSLENHENKEFGRLPRMVGWSQAVEMYDASERHDQSHVYENHNPSAEC